MASGTSGAGGPAAVSPAVAAAVVPTGAMPMHDPVTGAPTGIGSGSSTGTPDAGFWTAQAASARLQALAVTLAAAMPAVSAAAVENGELVVHASREGLLGLMHGLRDDPRTACEQLMDICGVDWPEREQRFDVVYNLLSVSLNHRIRVIVTTDAAMPVPSVREVWPCATWWERETWDLYGVLFSGQPDHRRILTDYGFEGHPLRKDFPLTGFVEVRYDEERKQVVNEQVRLTQDFRNFDFVSPWEGMVTLPGDEKAHETRMARAASAAAPRLGGVAPGQAAAPATTVPGAKPPGKAP